MRWNLNWERYNEGGKVETTNKNNAHEQIDKAIIESETFIPINKVKDLVNKTGISKYEAASILQLMPIKQGVASDSITYDEMSQFREIKQIMAEMVSNGSINNIINNITSQQQPNVPEVKANVPKPNPMVQGFNTGGVAKPKYPAFNMSPNNTPGGKTVPNKTIPSVKPTQNLGLNPNEAKLAAIEDKFRPKKTTPIGVPNPKNNQMNKLV